MDLLVYENRRRTLCVVFIVTYYSKLCSDILICVFIKYLPPFACCVIGLIDFDLFKC